MKTKVLSVMLVLMLGLVGCHNKEVLDESSGKLPLKTGIEFNIGVLVGSGEIDDRSFNQGAWEAIVQYTEKHPHVKAQMVIPKEDKLEAHLAAVEELITVKSDIIIAFGAEFNEVIEKAQDKYDEANYILLDGELNQISSNTVVVNFAQQEVGFLAGVAAALQSPNEKLGFIGGVKNANIERYGLGFKAGVDYANKTYNTSAEILDYRYQGAFNNPDEGQRLANDMFDQYITTIFVAAQGTGIGVMNEAKVRMEQDEEIYIIGSDMDQFEEGKIIDEKSVVLTSAVLHFDRALHEILDKYADQQFPGGQRFLKNIANDGIGLPEKNLNFLTETQVKVQEVTDEIRSGEKIIPESLAALREMQD